MKTLRFLLCVAVALAAFGAGYAARHVTTNYLVDKWVNSVMFIRGETSPIHHD